MRYEALGSLGLGLVAAAESTLEVCYFRLEPSDWCILKPQLLRRLRQEFKETGVQGQPGKHKKSCLKIKSRKKVEAGHGSHL